MQIVKEQVYVCDPEKNTECSKTSCHDLCWLTTHKEFSRDGIALTEEQERIFNETHRIIVDPNTHEWRGFLEENE